MLDEVKIVDKVMAMVQKDDTLEFNSRAYKVNPDADAADLIRKMPTIDINGKTVTSQGENITKIVVDGKPFFGNDPYLALKNLPADVIDKVQVYNEKTEQEQFTGFSEGNTTKTVNIITKKDKRKGVFGKVYGGIGPPESQETNQVNNDAMYGAGLSLNQFAGDRRITLTGQANNVNIQNFSDENTGGGASPGLATTNACGINYSDKWGKKTDISGSYFFSDVNSSAARETRKTYLVAVDSGQVYNEDNPSAGQNYSHRFNMRLNYVADSMNSILVQPQFSLSRTGMYATRQGKTVQGGALLNETANTNAANTKGINFSDNLLYRHKFRKKGATFSASLNTNNNGNDGRTIHTAQDVYYTSPALNDTPNQQTIQKQNTWNVTGNATYTARTGKKGLLKLEYNLAYVPSVSERSTNDFSNLTNTYSRADSQFSNDFSSRNIAHKAGASYQVHLGKAEFSLGVNYQLTALRNQQTEPVTYRLSQNFQNVLPLATFHYKISKTKNLQCTYNTSTQAPSVSQLQNVVNNTDPLHLYTGNPGLKQPYRHNLVIRYNATAKNAKNSFSATLTGAITAHNIASNSIIANTDTAIGKNIILARGSQLTIPVNMNGNRSANATISYGLPLDFIKCRLNMSINAYISRAPAIINNEANYQLNKNGGLNVSLVSNISESADFTVSSGLNITSNANSINTQLNTTYINGNSKASVNITFLKVMVFNSNISYQTNSGLSAGYNQNYALWNMSLGKKIFRKHSGDIRLSVFDILSENNSLQHTVTDTYIQDSRSTILQRYFLLVFTYKISEFRK